MNGRGRFRWMVRWLILLMPAAAGAHPALFTSAQVYIQPDGRFQLFTTFDLLAFTFQESSSEIADPPMNALLDGPEDTLTQKIDVSRAYFQASVKIETDQGPATVTRLQFPNLAVVKAWKESGRNPRLPVVADVELDGTLPQTASTIRCQFPPCLATVVLTVYRQGEEAYDEPINPGTASSAIPIQLERSAVAPPAPATVPPGRGEVWLRYIVMGVKHIIPGGADHLLFILGLFLASNRVTSLLWQITAFTAAHSITLALSLYGVFRLPSSVVEPAVVLTIIFVGVENLFDPRVGPSRVLAVFVFGLVHGLGFASALRDTGLPNGDFLEALVGFNVGVELGQLIVILVAFWVVGWFRGSVHYRNWVVIPGSLSITAIAVCWFVQRIVRVT